MMPEAFEHAGRAVALVTVLGFALGFAITERESAEPESATTFTRVTAPYEPTDPSAYTRDWTL
jgi:hypothetical protein